MPYYHSECGGRISILRRRCSKCKKKWGPKVWIKYPLPEDIVLVPRGHKILKSGKKSYARWADKYPEVAAFASRLPRWPRWARILVLILILALFVFLSYKLWGFISWIRR